MQADVRMKKKERARVFLALAPSTALSPNLSKTLVRALFGKTSYTYFAGAKMRGPYSALNRSQTIFSVA